RTFLPATLGLFAPLEPVIRLAALLFASSKNECRDLRRSA
ncbi:MAG: hypothetical protein ACI91G_001235, partial [Gammaproteobacteria bacterium]